MRVERRASLSAPSQRNRRPPKFSLEPLNHTHGDRVHNLLISPGVALRWLQALLGRCIAQFRWTGRYQVPRYASSSMTCTRSPAGPGASSGSNRTSTDRNRPFSLVDIGSKAYARNTRRAGVPLGRAQPSAIAEVRQGHGAIISRRLEQRRNWPPHPVKVLDHYWRVSGPRDTDIVRRSSVKPGVRARWWPRSGSRTNVPGWPTTRRRSWRADHGFCLASLLAAAETVRE